MKDLDGKGPTLRANSAPSGSRSNPAAVTNAQHRLDDYIRSRESTALVGENASFLHSFPSCPALLSPNQYARGIRLRRMETATGEGDGKEAPGWLAGRAGSDHPVLYCSYPYGGKQSREGKVTMEMVVPGMRDA